MRFISLSLVLLALAGFASAAQARRDLTQSERFADEATAFIESILAGTDAVPGCALAVVVDDQVVFANGFGWADVENEVPATADATYYIASSTKPFTALAASILHERGVIDLDSSLSEHLDGVVLDPSLDAGKITLRDLLRHTSGMRNDPITYRLAYSGDHTPEILWQLLERTEANEVGLGAFDYTNFGYNLLTMILDRELGKSWKELLRDEIFTPAALTRTTAYASLPHDEGWPVAVPYFGLHPDGLQRLYLEKQDNTMQSAGGMVTTANDAARWMLLQLHGGQLDGTQVIDADALHATQQRWVEIEDESRSALSREACGLGWMHGEYAGQRILHHSGGFAGFRSLISFMPESGVGVTVLVNEASIGSGLVDVISSWAYDWWLERSPEAAEASLHEQLGRVAMIRERVGEDLANRAGRDWDLTQGPAAYAGTYHSEDYGTLRIEHGDGGYQYVIGNLSCTATPYTKPDTMRVELVPGRGEVAAFEMQGGVASAVQLGEARFQRMKD